jgi:hypothetical protein
MGMSDKFIPGDHYILCEATGFKIRKSEAVQQWDGAWVKKGFEDPKHPLDEVRTPTPARPAYPVRSEPTDSFVTVPLSGIETT